MNGRAGRSGTRALAISDEVALRRLLRARIHPSHYELTTAPHSAELTTAAAPEILIIDLPAFGPEPVEHWRRRFPEAEIIILSSVYHERDGAQAIEMGVECLSRPFRDADLASRLHAAELRGLAKRGLKRYYRIGAAEFDVVERWIVVKDSPIALSEAEFTLLCRLACCAEREVEVKNLIATLGRANDGEGRQRPRALVFGLRRKLASDAARSLIATEPRVGYRLAIEAGADSPGRRVERQTHRQGFPCRFAHNVMASGAKPSRVVMLSKALKGRVPGPYPQLVEGWIAAPLRSSR